jgi:heme/copper-type cytochrome/quinol oxidase subunit 1
MAWDGMPCRVCTYLAGMGWSHLNLLASLGAGLIALSVLMFIGNVLWSARGARSRPKTPGRRAHWNG